MSRRPVEYQGRELEVALVDDVARPTAGWLFAVAHGRLIDEITGGPPLGPVTVRVDRGPEGLRGHVSAGGRVGAVGVPQRLFPLPATLFDFELTVEAEGFLPLHRTVQLTTDAAFPDVFVPVDLNLPDLHRAPLPIRGRVTKRTLGGTVPVAGATVRIDRVWPARPSSAMPGEIPDCISVQPSLFMDLTVAGQVRAVTFNPAVGTFTLLEPSGAGQQELRLSNRVGLGPGSILSVDTTRDDRLEFNSIVALSNASVSDQEPATATLERPLAFSHPRETQVDLLTVAGTGTANALRRPALTGDSCLFLNGLAGLSAASRVEIDDGTGTVDYHVMRSYEATTDPDGDFALPSISRLARIVLFADDGGGLTASVPFDLDYRAQENLVHMTVA